MNTNVSGENRTRETLKFKRDVVMKYLAFVKAPPPPSKVTIMEVSGTESTDQDSEDDEDDDENKEQDQVRTIKNFLASYNKERQAANEKSLLHGCLFKWLKSFERGELDDWEGMNPLNKPNSKAKKIVEHICKVLKTEFPETARFNKLIRKSPSSPEKYGVLAKKHIPKGTFLGFFSGELVNDLGCEQTGIKVVLDDFYLYRLGNYSYIDGRSFTSCYARYYAWSGDIHKQNVSVHLLGEWSDHTRAVCFMANKDIAKDEELVTPVNLDYIGKKKHMKFEKASCSDNELAAQQKAHLFIEVEKRRREKARENRESFV
jgi:hypothetical protein